MDSSTTRLVTTLLTVGLVSFLLWLLYKTANFPYKKAIMAGIVAATVGMSLLLLGGAPINTGFIFVTLCLAILGVLSVFGRSVSNYLFLRFYNKYGMLRIQEIKLTTNVSQAGFPTWTGFKFSQTNRRIYCFITYRSIATDYMRVVLHVKWYYQDKEIHCSTHPIKAQHPILTYIETPQNDLFPQGRYMVELIIEQFTKVRVKRVEFEIVKE